MSNRLLSVLSLVWLVPSVALCAELKVANRSIKIGTTQESYDPRTCRGIGEMMSLQSKESVSKFSCCQTRIGCGATQPTVTDCSSSSEGSSVTYCDSNTGELIQCQDEHRPDGGGSCGCSAIGRCTPPVEPNPHDEARRICWETSKGQIDSCVAQCDHRPMSCFVECTSKVCDNFGACVAEILGDDREETPKAEAEWCDAEIWGR